MLTDSRILEDDEKASVILPFDFEASILILKLCEDALDVLRLEFLRESGQVKNAGDGGRETREVGGHDERYNVLTCGETEDAI